MLPFHGALLCGGCNSDDDAPVQTAPTAPSPLPPPPRGGTRVCLNCDIARITLSASVSFEAGTLRLPATGDRDSSCMLSDSSNVSFPTRACLRLISLERNFFQTDSRWLDDGDERK
jgi:hypothetical protein